MNNILEDMNEAVNPLDMIEIIFKNNNWSYIRQNETKLSVEIDAKNCAYTMTFYWEEFLSALQFSCDYDFHISEQNMGTAAPVLMRINSDMWMGRFDIKPGCGTPSFRQTCLYRGLGKYTNAQHIEDVIEIALNVCEHHYTAFYLLSHANDDGEQIEDHIFEAKPESGSLYDFDNQLSLALMDVAGEC